MPIVHEVYYHEYQKDETLPLVLIHGAGGNHLYWPPEIRRLSGYRVLAIDLPGHGKSTGRGYQSIVAYRDAVLEWLLAIGISRAVFVGHSMGSAIVQMIAIENPEHVLGLILLGSATSLVVNPALLEDTSHPSTFHNIVDKVIDWSFSPQTPDRLIDLARKRMLEIRPSVLRGDFLACNDYDATSRISSIIQPTLVICGDEDKMTPLRNAKILSDNIPSAQIEIIPEAGHMVMLEKPQAVAEAMINFLKNIQF